MYRLLEGLTVVEGAAFIAGPSCGLYFAQLGATVIRFDQRGGGPDAHRWPVAENGKSHYRDGLNAGKKSVAIDLAQPAGRELAQRLAVSGDRLFVTNFPCAGFLSYDRLAALRADLVCLRIMGWPDGTPAVDYTINAAIGLPLMTGPADDRRPVNHVLPAWDLLAGAYGAFALLAAERERQASGMGRELRLALSDIAATSLGHLGMVAEAMAAGNRVRSGNDLFGAFGRDFVTGDGARLMIVAITRRQWEGLLSALAIGPEVAALEASLDLSFAADEGARFIHRAVLNPIVERAVQHRVVAELGAAFDAAGVCWSVYRSVAEAIADEPRFVTGNPVFAAATHPSGAFPTPGAAVRIGQDERAPPGAAVPIGADTDEVLADLLGMGSGEIGRLRDQGLVG